MLSYLLPVEDKSHPSHHLNLDLNLNSDNSKPTKCAANEPSDKNCLPSVFESKNISIAFKKSKANENRLFLKNNMASTEVQRPKSLEKLNPTVQPHVTNMETVNEETENTTSGGGSILSGASLHATASNDGKHGKTSKLGNTKNAALKRVSFGSSKGSMVETLVFETPTPLPEHAERAFSFPPEQTNPSNATKSSTAQENSCNNSSSHLDDSGIELQEELERSKVRVTFYQSGKPQLISPPEPQFFDFFDGPVQLNSDTAFHPNETNFSVDTGMATLQSTIPVNYDRQISTESGWDNPFRPGGELSKEADEIVNLIKGGKPITPNDINNSVLNGNRQLNGHSPENGALTETVTKTEVSQNQQSPLAGNDKTVDKNGDANQSNTQISNSVVPGPQSASHVVVEDKKKKKCTCCVIQ